MKNIRALFALCMLAVATFVWAEPANPHTSVVTGEVQEVLNVSNFTYLRLKTKEGETWAAVMQAPVQQGAVVTIENAIVMNNFESKSLKKTFSSILFGNLAGVDASSTANMPANSNGNHVAGMALPLIPKKQEVSAGIHIKKAKGENSQTVADIMTKGAELKDKPVLLRGKVVKYNEGIMGKNWLHLRDGTGSVENDTNDVLVTTTSSAKVGDIVTAKGVVHIDKDFGAGYSYKVLVEDATLQ